MLVVDDVDINREILSLYFRDKYEIVEAANGQEALDIIMRQRVDIILLDIVMPVMGGMELLEILHQSDTLNNIPVIVTTSQESVNKEVRAMEMGAADFVTKPYNPTVVKCRVHNVMARQENEWRKLEQAAQDDKIKRMKHDIEIDALTGIYNRDSFITNVTRLLQENRDIRYSMVCFDISGFRMINELFNVETGDVVLKTAAAYFRTVSGKRGIAGSLSADRFALCIPKDSLDIELLIQGLDGLMRSMALYRDLRFYAGVYHIDNIYLSVAQMIDRAHLALKRIKGLGKERFAVYDDALRNTLVEEQMVNREMELALESGQFVVYMQPIYDMSTNQLIGAETMPRWVHPTKGIIEPDHFLPIFEKNGFITKLDRYIWEKVSSFISEERYRGLNVLPVEIILSKVHLYDPGFTDYLISITRQHEVEADKLLIGVTEDAYNDNPQMLIKVLKKLQTNGFKIVLDDFGREHGSLNLLRVLPADYLKVNASFIKDVPSGKPDLIVESFVKMAEAMDMQLFIGGVETEAEADLIRRAGCSLISGYGHAKPMPADEYIGFLEKLADGEL